MATDWKHLAGTGMPRALGVAVTVLLLGNGVGLSLVGASGDESLPHALPSAQAPMVAPSGAAAPNRATTTAPAKTQPAPTSTQKATPSEVTASSAPFAAYNQGGYPLDLRIEPTCAPVGATMTATAKLEPRGSIALIAVYADGNAHETRHAAYREDGGTVSYTWTVPNVPGDASLIAQAGDIDGKRKTTKTIPFRVVKAATRC